MRVNGSFSVRTRIIDGHKNICRGTTTWELKDHGGENSVRDFDTVEEMNTALVEGINKYVGRDDWLVCLGDWSFGGIDNIWNFRKRINCENIILIYGNHDHHIVNDRLLENVEIPLPTRDGEDIRWVPSAQGVFQGLCYPYLELTVNDANNGGPKTTFNLFHFPITIWNKAHKDRIHLYGHCHGGYTAPDRSMDVGFDRAFELFGEYRPFTLEDIHSYMEGRTYLQRDHHNKNTN